MSFFVTGYGARPHAIISKTKTLICFAIQNSVLGAGCFSLYWPSLRCQWYNAHSISRLLMPAMFFTRRIRHRKKASENVSILPAFVNGPASFRNDVMSWCVLISGKSNLWRPSHKMVEKFSMTSKFKRSPASLSQPAERLVEVFTIHSIKNHICNVVFPRCPQKPQKS